MQIIPAILSPQNPDPQYVNTAYYHSDGKGNVTALVQPSGFPVAIYQYDPYGNILGVGGLLADVNKYRFSSKEWNDNAGLYYYGYRFYDPNLQRWLNRDPIQELGGFNMYDYVMNGPRRWLDPFGLQCEDFDLPDPFSSEEVFGRNDGTPGPQARWPSWTPQTPKSPYDPGENSWEWVNPRASAEGQVAGGVSRIAEGYGVSDLQDHDSDSQTLWHGGPTGFGDIDLGNGNYMLVFYGWPPLPQLTPPGLAQYTQYDDNQPTKNDPPITVSPPPCHP